MTRRFRLAASGALALLAAAACALYGQQVREEAERVRAEALERYGGEVVQLVVAPEGLEAGDVVDRGNVTEREWLVELVPEGAVTSVEAVLGASVTVPAAAGAPLTSLNFRESADALEVPDGLVAISVPVTDDLALPRLAKAGSTLSAYAVSDDGVRLLTSSVQVLEALGEKGGLAVAGELTVAVAPEDVAPVLAASASGSLRLTLPSEEAASVPEGSVQAPTEVTPEGEQEDAPSEGAGTSEGGDEQ